MARASELPADVVFREAAWSLIGFVEDPAALVTGCRRLLDRHPTNGPIWWLCSRVLRAEDPVMEAEACVLDLDLDRTLDDLSHAFDEESKVAAVGWPPRLASSFARRGDVEVLVIDVEGDGPGFVRALEDVDVVAVDVDVPGMAAAVASSDVLVVDAAAVGPESAIVASGNWAAAAVARASSVPVWLVVGTGRRFGERTWNALCRRVERPGRPSWLEPVDRLPLDLVDRVFGAGDVVPDVPELWR